MFERSLRELLRKIATVRRGLGLVWHSARGWTLAWVVLLLIQGLVPALQIQLTRTVINRLSSVALGGDWRHPAIWVSPDGCRALKRNGSRTTSIH